MTEKQLAAVRKAYINWGGAFYVLGPDDKPPKEYFMWCKAIERKREGKFSQENLILMQRSLELINKRRGT